MSGAGDGKRWFVVRAVTHQRLVILALDTEEARRIAGGRWMRGGVQTAVAETREATIKEAAEHEASLAGGKFHRVPRAKVG